MCVHLAQWKLYYSKSGAIICKQLLATPDGLLTADGHFWKTTLPQEQHSMLSFPVTLASINLNGTLPPPHTEQQVLRRHPMFEAGRLLATHADPLIGQPRHHSSIDLTICLVWMALALFICIYIQSKWVIGPYPNPF